MQTLWFVNLYRMAEHRLGHATNSFGCKVGQLCARATDLTCIHTD